MRSWKCAPAPAILVWRFDRDGRSRPGDSGIVAADMAGMMSHVVERRHRTRAALDGIPTAGKTGTTNAYRDAWFIGYTGNFTCAVWFGNDDYSPTNRMTGGSLPAQTWHDIMVAAHQGVEIKELAGVGMGMKLPTRRAGSGCGHPRCAEDYRHQAGTAAGPHQTRCGHPGAGREGARRRSKGGRQDRGRSNQAGAAGVVDSLPLPDSLASATTGERRHPRARTKPCGCYSSPCWRWCWPRASASA